MFSDKTYDTIKKAALIAAPVVTFVSTVLNIWKVPYTAQITATLAAVNVLLGAIVTVAKAKYDKEQGDES